MADSLPPSEHRYGRGGFLLLVAGGASSLLWAGPVSSFLSPLTSAGSQLVGNLFPVGGWRIYTISGSMPIFDPSSWRLEIGGLVKRPRTLTYDQVDALPKAEYALSTGTNKGQNPQCLRRSCLLPADFRTSQTSIGSSLPSAHSM